jgi:hypothetical protein
MPWFVGREGRGEAAQHLVHAGAELAEHAAGVGAGCTAGAASRASRMAMLGASAGLPFMTTRR